MAESAVADAPPGAPPESAAARAEAGAGLGRVAGEMAVSLGGLGIGRGLNFAVQVVLARGLGPAGFGLYVLATTVLRLADILARVGMDSGAIRFVSLRTGDRRAVREVAVGTLAMLLATSAVTGLAVFLAAPVLSEAVFRVERQLVAPLRLVALFVPAAAGLAVGAALTRGFRRTVYTVLARDIAQPVVQAALLAAMLVAGLGLSGALLSYGVSLAAAFVLALFFLYRLCGGARVPLAAAAGRGREVLGYSAPLLLVGGIHYVITWLDTLLLGLYRGPADVGVYRAAAQLPLMLPVLLAASNSIYGPTVSVLLHRGERASAGVLLRTTSRWLAWLGIPAFAVMFVCAADIVALFGDEFVAAGAPVLRVLAVAQLFSVLTGGVGQTLTLTGHQRLELYNSFGMVAVNVAMCLVLIPRWGARGAAVASAVSIVGLNAARMAEVWKVFRMSPFDRGSLVLAAGGAVALGAGWAAHAAVEGPVLRVLAAAAAVAVCFGAAVAWRGIGEEDRRVYRQVRERARRREAPPVVEAEP